MRSGVSAIFFSFSGSNPNDICVSWSSYHDDCAPTNTLSSGIWQHIAVVFTASGIKIYKDGTQVYTASSSLNTFPLTGSTFRIALDPDDNARTFKGEMDEVRIWTADKTTDITSKSYRCSPSLLNTTGLLFQYKFDEGSGTTTANSSSSGATYNGTLTNGPTWGTSTILTDVNSPCYTPPSVSAPIFDLKPAQVFATEVE